MPMEPLEDPFKKQPILGLVLEYNADQGAPTSEEPVLGITVL